MKINNAKLVLAVLIMVFVGSLLWAEVQPKEVIPTNEDVAMAYMTDEHPELNCGSVEVYDESDGDISFISYDSEGNPKICATIDKDYYTNKYFE